MYGESGAELQIGTRVAFIFAPGRQRCRRSGGSREGGEPRVSERLAYGIGDLHLSPGKETIPLEELFRSTAFPRNPTCYTELFPGLPIEARNRRRSLCALSV